MKKIIRIESLLIAIMLLFSSAACTKKKTEAKINTVSYDDLELPDDYISDTVAENETYSLSWDGDSACVIVTEKATGKVWSTVPYDFYSSEKKSNQSNISMLSPLNVTYVTSDNKSAQKTVNGYNGVLKKGSIYTKQIENGIKIYYCFDKLEIVIPVEYTLRENGICVSIVPGEIVEYEKLVYKVSIAPFFCSTENSADKKNHYLVVPSGSGALMYTDVRGEGVAREYCEEVYGRDPACYQGEQTLNTQSVRLAMFGAKSGDRAVCGVIEQGAPCASVNAVSGDVKIGYSSVYPTFCLRGSNISAIAFQGGNVAEVETIADDICTYEKLSVGYYFLSGDHANYTGMAKIYREYLSEKSTDNKELDESELMLKILGGLQLKKLMLGLPYRKTTAATTFTEALDIVKQVEKETGVSPDIFLSGFGESGLDVGKLAGGFKFSSVFGSEKDFSELQQYCEKQNLGLYPDFDIMRFNNSSNGFLKTFDAAKASNSLTAYQYFYSVSLREKDENDQRYVLLSRSKLGDAANRLISFAKKKKLSGLAISTVGSLAYSDYDSSDYAVRRNADNDAMALITSFKNAGYSVALSDANDYAAILADSIADVPVNSSMYDSLDVDIPLYQIVFKGMTSLTTAPVNTAVNSRKQFLKSIEGGSGLSFSVCANFEASFATTKHSALAVSLVSDNMKLIKDLMRESGSYYKTVKGAHISGHEILSETLRRTDFDNGAHVFVNYSDSDEFLPEGTVKANGFLISKEDD